MTRDEAINAIDQLKEHYLMPIECIYVDAITEIEAKTVMHMVYDDFVSRTCENCKHFTFMSRANSYICSSLDNQSVKWIEKDFGCNKFERRVE